MPIEEGKVLTFTDDDTGELMIRVLPGLGGETLIIETKDEICELTGNSLKKLKKFLDTL